MRTYLAPVLVSVGYVLVTPLGMLVVFLSGDSCCGEDTTGTMAGVTALVVALICGSAWAVAVALEDAARRPAYRRRRAWAIMAGPASLILVVFVAWIAVAAF